MEPQMWSFGAPVAGYRWSPPDMPRARVLLAHGFAEYAGRYVAHYDRLIPRLVERGIAVFAFDYRGHGGSAGRRGVVDVGEAVAQHRAARRALTGAEPLILFGHSLGGLVTAASVAGEPGAEAGVVLSSALLLVEAPPLMRLVGRVLARVAPGAGIRPALDPAGISRDPAEVAAYRDDPQGYHGPLPALTGASILATAAAMWPRVPEWRAPLLALHGTADLFTDPRGSERFVAAAGATDTRLELVPDGRHELLNDLGREAISALVLEWMEARLQRVARQI